MTLRGSKDFDATAAAFVRAAVDPTQWASAMEVAAEATDSFGAMLIPFHHRLPNLPRSTSMEPVIEDYVGKGWIESDERRRSIPMLLRRGVATDLDFMTTAQISRHPYYQELLAPHGLRWFAGVYVACGEDQWCLALQRSIQQGPFLPQEIKRLAALSEKLGSAAALARALGHARAEAALQAFHVSNLAVVLLNRSGEVLHANAAAERKLRGDPRIERSRVLSMDRDATRALDRALHAILWSQGGSALMGPVPLPRRDKRPMLAYPVRLEAANADALADCQALLVLVDPDERPRPPEGALRSSFGLSIAEARLAMHLAAGQTLEAASQELGIAKETARVQLKALFAKLDVHRQSQLVALLARLLSESATTVSAAKIAD
jgi:DNA-binding CsgD family transcriptional regulator